MSLPADIPLAVANVLGYLQHHLQELTEHQNASEHTINATLAGLTAQLQQLTQLITALTPIVALLPIPTSPPLVSPSSPVLSTLSKQQIRPKLCHKLHLAISSPILRRFPRSQSELKALQKTFRSVPVTSRGNQ